MSKPYNLLTTEDKLDMSLDDIIKRKKEYEKKLREAKLREAKIKSKSRSVHKNYSNSSLELCLVLIILLLVLLSVLLSVLLLVLLLVLQFSMYLC
jgi:hypothetical protein